MIKLFCIVPMKDRSNDDILKSIKYIEDRAKTYFAPTKVKIIHNFELSHRVPKNVKHLQAHYISRAVDKISKCNGIIYAANIDFNEYVGCRIERDIAFAYKIPRYVLGNINDTLAVE